MSPARTKRNFRKDLGKQHFGSTYIVSSVAFESAGKNLDICSALDMDSTPLKVSCPPPGIGAKT
jgi:hypothetical protein